MTRLESPGKAVLSIAAVAWLALLGLALSPWAAEFSHGALERIGAHPWETATLAAGWLLMVGAMMLPTTVPLVSQFTLTTRPSARALSTLLLAYAAVWLAAGLAMHVGDLGIHWLVRRSIWLDGHAWVIEATTLAAAGVYQFTSMKARSLCRCRAPGTSIRPGDPWHTGLDHGASCLGSCWPLMLVMFSVGVASLEWMLALTAVMLAEKTLPVGPRVTRPAGVWLIAAAVGTAVAAG
jgi:predicted metal-binding membrane protein